MPQATFIAERQKPIIYFPYQTTEIATGSLFTYGFILGNTQNNFAFQFLGRLAFGYVNVDVQSPNSQLFLLETAPIYMAGFVKSVVIPAGFRGHVGLILYPSDSLDLNTVTLVV